MIALVVTYFPDDEVADNIAAIAREFGDVIVVDNGSPQGSTASFRTLPGVDFVALDANHGVAAALNLGFERAVQRGETWVVSFDQDSRPISGFALALATSRAGMGDAAVIGANIVEAAMAGDYTWLRPGKRCEWLFERVPCSSEDLLDVSMVVTSGALTSVEVWRELGGFDESLFIDFVDTDFCLRVRATGRRIGVSNGAVLHHKLGQRERREIFGFVFHPTHHPAFRHYFIARNRVSMLSRHGIREPHWLKLKAMVLGTWDGLRGRSGPMPEHRARALRP